MRVCQTGATMAKELPIVADPADMSNETFLKHWAARHSPVVGLRLHPELNSGVIESLRAYHDRVHAQGFEEDPAKHQVVNGKIIERSPQVPVNHDHLEG